MKKTVLLVALAFGVSSAFAQLTSKKGEPYLPEAGDWAIGMDVSPIFQYMGNFFSQNGNPNVPGVGFVNNDLTIIGKKFNSATDASRALVRIGFTSSSNKNNVTEDLVTPPVFPNAAPVVEDKRKSSSMHIALGAGKEMRRGKTRLQGVYGADAMIWFATHKEKTEYGNSMTATNPDPTSTDWTYQNPDGSFLQSAQTSRTLEMKSGATFGLGVRGFIGCEYFLIPKISLGAEFGWGLGVQTRGKGTTTTELSGTNANGDTVVAEQEKETAGASRFGFDTDINQSNAVFDLFGADGSNTGTATVRAIFHF